MKQQNDVVVIGNIGIDTQAYLYGDEIDFSGEANFTQNVDSIGQAGGYAVRAYTGLGWKTAFIGTVGDDLWGRHIREDLVRKGVDIRGLWIDPEGTGRSVNIVNRKGERKNFYDGKGHMHLHPPMDACRQVLEGSKLAHFNIPNWARELIPLAKELRLRIACDVQDLVRIDDPYRLDFMLAADYLFFSAVNFRNAEDLVRQVHRAAPQAMLVSGMGKEGCLVWADGRMTHFPAFASSQAVMDTNGAGDTLACVFLVEFELKKKTIAQAVMSAQRAARWICSMQADKKCHLEKKDWQLYLGADDSAA